MNKIYLSLIAFVGINASIMAQTSHEVNVSNFLFTPSQLEILPGDTVRWTNTMGLHSVNGSLSVFPDNPEGFGNEVAISPWTYEYVFTLPGTYGYRCEQHPNTMLGTIIVTDTTSGIAELRPNYFAFFPNPVVHTLSWKRSAKTVPTNCVFLLFNIEGKQILKFSLAPRTSYDVSALSDGIYTYRITIDNKLIQKGKLLIEKY